MILQCFEANKTMTMSFTLIQHMWSCMPSDQWVQFAAHLPPSDEKDCNSLESGMIMQKEFCGTVSSCTQETCNFFKLAVLFLICKKMSLETFHIYSLTLAWTGLGRVVWLPLATLDSPVVHAVVMDGVSQGHLLVTGCQG